MCKKKVLLRFLLILCFSLSACNNEDTDKRSFFEKGVMFYENGEFKKAKLEIKSAIQKNPGMAEPYYYLALLNEKDRKFKAMKANLIKSIKIDPEYTLAKLKLGKVYLLFNQVEQALKEVNTILLKEPDQLDALTLNASILVRQNKTKEALAVIDNVLNKDASHIDALSLKIVLLMREDAFDEALALLTPAIQNDEKNITLHLLKIQLDTKRKDTPAVVKGYEKLIDLKPDDIRVKYALAKVYLDSGEKLKSEEVLRNLVKDKPDLIEAKIALLDLLYLIDKSKAEKQIKLFVDENKENQKVLIKLSNWLVSKGDSVKAVEILNTVLMRNDIAKKDKMSINLLLAKIEISNKNFKNGSTYIDNILKEDAENSDAKLLRAKVLFANERNEDAVKVLDEILWQTPNMDEALSLLGAINLIEGDADKAGINFKEALKRNPANLVALKFIVGQAVNEKHVDYGIEVLERALRYLPTNMSLLIKLIELNIDEQNWDVASKYINVIKQKNNGAVYAQYFNARVFQKQNKYKKAIVIYKEILKNYPGLKDALTAMVECYSALNQQSIMKKYLDEMIQNYPTIIPFYLLKSQLLSGEKQNVSASELLKKALSVQGNKSISLYLELARQYAILGNKKAENKTYSEGLSHFPDSVALLLQVASFYEQEHEFNKAVEQYESLIAIAPRQNIAKNNLASLLLDHFGNADDIDKAVQLTKTFKQSKQPYFLDTYGWAQLKKGNIDKSLAVFKKVVLLDPDTLIFRYHLAEAYFAQGDTMTAASELKQALYFGKGKETEEKVLINELLTKIKNQP